MDNPFQTEITQMPTSKSSVICFLFLSAFSCLIFLSEAAPIYSDHACTDSITYQPNTTFQTNLNLLLSSLSSKASEGGNHFYRTRAGSVTPDVITGLFLCRRDILTTACHECVTAAAAEIKRRCPNEKEAIIWYDECMLRYSNQSFLNNIVPSVDLYNSKSIPRSELDQFNELLADMLNDLATKAANSLNYATGEVKFTSTVNLYGLVQCTPDLTLFDCNMCFRSAIASVPNCCNGKQGARVLLPGCNIRYELYPFYNSTATLSQPRPPGRGRSSVSIIISFVIAIFASVVLFVFCSFVEKHARNRIQLWKNSRTEFSRDIEESDTGKNSRDSRGGTENFPK